MTSAEALAAVRVRPDDAAAHFNLGQALRQEGRLAEATASYREAVRLRPDFALAHNTLGIALAQLGRPDEALASFQESLRHDPTYAAAHNNLGKLLQDLGRLAEAEASYRQAVLHRPDHAMAYYNLGVALEQQRRWQEAATNYRQAVHLRPDYAEAFNNLGNAYLQLGDLDQARASLLRALHLEPRFAQAHANLGNVCRQQGTPAEARRHLQEALRLQPSPALQVSLATLLPPVYQSAAELHAWRERFTRDVNQLDEAGVRINLDQEPALPAFFLAYQGQNDRDLQRTLARLHQPGTTAGPSTGRASPGDKIRIGFVSSHFYNHTIGRLMQGLIANLSRQKFAVTVFAIAPRDDELSRSIRGHADHYVPLSAHLPFARRALSDTPQDVLFYPDLGMDPASYGLALHRLAPVQCTTWGHPVTSGMDTIDYFFSSEVLDLPDAQEHYAEKLVRLKHLPICYDRPMLRDPPPGRAHFSLPETGHLYGCLQSLFKLHPEFDELLGGILRGDPQGVLVFLEGTNSHWADLLRQRFAATLPDVADRVRFLPLQSREDFLGLSAAVDVLLDPIHFGGGNTSYEGLAFGVPIVTLPSPYLRGRITLALYEQMGLLDCVVPSHAAYIDLVVRLGTDPAYRAEMQAKIRAANPVLYGNTAGVRELEEFLIASADDAARRG
jgi:predicted O-linked N-acetylglucosamine transferase (SPINDLY family)